MRRSGAGTTPGEGVTLLKIDRELFDNPGLAKSATVYAVANVDAAIFGRDGDGDGRPDGIRNRGDLEQFVYRPASGTVSTGLPAEGMPMVGVRTLDLTGGTPENDRQVELTALMARIDVTIQLDSEVQDGNLPAFYLMDWTARNLPTQVAFTAPDAGAGPMDGGVDHAEQRLAPAHHLQPQRADLLHVLHVREHPAARVEDRSGRGVGQSERRSRDADRRRTREGALSRRGFQDPAAALQSPIWPMPMRPPSSCTDSI